MRLWIAITSIVASGVCTFTAVYIWLRQSSDKRNDFSIILSPFKAVGRWFSKMRRRATDSMHTERGPISSEERFSPNSGQA